MANDFLHVRVDPEKKMEAERILKSLGLTLTAGVNLCLSGIIRAKGLPFEVKLSREEILGERALQAEAAFQKAVDEQLAQDRAHGYPIALYDPERKRPYLEYPDGSREYNDA